MTHAKKLVDRRRVAQVDEACPAVQDLKRFAHLYHLTPLPPTEECDVVAGFTEDSVVFPVVAVRDGRLVRSGIESDGEDKATFIATTITRLMKLGDPREWEQT